MRKIKVFAHRGGMKRGLENTIVAFHQAYNDGANGIECDGRMSADGKVFIFHDNNTKRITGDDLVFAKSDAKTIESLRIKDFFGARILTLTEIFFFAKEYSMRFFIELKEQPAILGKKILIVAETLDIANETSTLLSFAAEKNQLRQIKKDFPSAVISVMAAWPKNLAKKSERMRRE